MAVQFELATLQDQLNTVDINKISIKKEEDEINQEINRLITLPKSRELEEIRIETQKLISDFNRHLRSLRKPFIKFRVFLLRENEKSLTPEEFIELDKYIENPFKAFSTDQDNYFLLRKILEKVEWLINNGKLHLKSDKKRKAKTAINQILHQNSLVIFQKRCKILSNRKQQLLKSSEVNIIQIRQSELQQQSNLVALDVEKIELEEQKTRKKLQNLQGSIQNLKNQIEQMIHNVLHMQVHIL